MKITLNRQKKHTDILQKQQAASETECLLKSLGKAVIRATIIHENTEEEEASLRTKEKALHTVFENHSYVSLVSIHFKFMQLQAT